MRRLSPSSVQRRPVRHLESGDQREAIELAVSESVPWYEGFGEHGLIGRTEAAACSSGGPDDMQRTFSGRTCAPRSFRGSLSFRVWPRKRTLITMGVSSVTGTLVAAMEGK